jgi:hypothetical protein
MIESFAREIHPSLYGVSGKVFYSGRDAFAERGGLYVLGYNPGGDPGSKSELTIRDHNDFVLSKAPRRWSEYCDASWLGRAPGQKPFQRRVQHLLSRLGADPRLMPSSNLIFVRSPRSTHIASAAADLEKLCWPLHANVIEELKPRAIICLGNETGARVRHRVRADRVVGRFVEQNDRRWQSDAHRNRDGLLVFTLSHPSVADWTNPATDPSPMVLAALKRS